MTHPERELLTLIAWLPDRNLKAIALQTFIQKTGALTDEAADAVRKLLTEEKKDDRGPS